MRYLVAAALAATVSAGLTAGSCPTVTSDYWKPEMRTETDHYLLYLDETFYEQV